MKASNMTTAPPDSLDSLVSFFENIRPESIAEFPRHYAEDAYFKDPFNEVHGVAAIQNIFAHMFKQVDAPRFDVTERVADANSAMLVWDFFYCLRHKKQGKTQHIRGVSHLKFDIDGKINYHRDYWDAAEELYMKQPVIGPLMRFLQRMASASG